MTRQKQLMLRIHGDGSLLRSLLSNAQEINAYRQTGRLHEATAIENDLHYREDSPTVAINSQSR